MSHFFLPEDRLASRVALGTFSLSCHSLPKWASLSLLSLHISEQWECALQSAPAQRFDVLVHQCLLSFFFFFFCKHDSISWESQSVGVQPWTVYSVGESHPNDAWKPVRLVSPRQTLEKERRDGETSATWTAECNRGLSASVNLVSAAWRDIKPSRTFNRDL